MSRQFISGVRVRWWVIIWLVGVGAYGFCQEAASVGLASAQMLAPKLSVTSPQFAGRLAQSVASAPDESSVLVVSSRIDPWVSAGAWQDPFGMAAFTHSGMKGVQVSDRVFWDEMDARKHEPNSRYLSMELRQQLQDWFEEHHILPDTGRILDLMSGEFSSFTAGARIVDGVGISEVSLRQNRILDNFFVHDLNAQPDFFPESEQLYDATVISMGIMYLRRPVAVLRAVARHLHDAGPLVVIWHERYYNTARAVNAWNRPEFYDAANKEEIVQRYLAAAGFERGVLYCVTQASGLRVMVSRKMPAAAPGRFPEAVFAGIDQSL